MGCVGTVFLLQESAFSHHLELVRTFEGASSSEVASLLSRLSPSPSTVNLTGKYAWGSLNYHFRFSTLDMRRKRSPSESLSHKNRSKIAVFGPSPNELVQRQ